MHLEYRVIATFSADSAIEEWMITLILWTQPTHMHDLRFCTLVVIFIASILLYPVIWVYNDVNTPVLTL